MVLLSNFTYHINVTMHIIGQALAKFHSNRVDRSNNKSLNRELAKIY